jgi:FkbM family methyltransferase
MSLRSLGQDLIPSQSFLVTLRKANEHWLWRRKVRVFGNSFEAPTLDRLVSLWLHKVGILGREETLVLQRLLGPGMTTADVGANQGIYTLLLANLVRPAKVFAFEPEPMLYQRLVSNVLENRVNNVVCHQIAVSSSSGKLAMRPGEVNLGDNRIVPIETAQSRQIAVDAVRLDEIFSDQTIDFLKMDIQGWEGEALLGARRLLERSRNITIMLELWPYGLLRAGTRASSLITNLRELGFVLWRIDKGRFQELKEEHLPDPNKEFAYCNVLCSRNPFLCEETFSEGRAVADLIGRRSALHGLEAK